MTYVGLAATARAECSGLVTEASSERTFKDSGWLLSAYRGNFLTVHVEQLMFLRKNKKWLPALKEIEDEYFRSGGEDTHENALDALLAKAKAEFELQQKAKKARSRGGCGGWAIKLSAMVARQLHFS